MLIKPFICHSSLWVLCHASFSNPGTADAFAHVISLSYNVFPSEPDLASSSLPLSFSPSLFFFLFLHPYLLPFILTCAFFLLVNLLLSTLALNLKSSWLRLPSREVISLYYHSQLVSVSQLHVILNFPFSWDFLICYVLCEPCESIYLLSFLYFMYIWNWSFSKPGLELTIVS